MAVNKDTDRKETWRISDMVKSLPEEYTMPIQPQGDASASPSASRIKELALLKREEYLAENEEKTVKKASFRFVLIAAMVCLVSVTAFAAFGGMDLIRSIFGESADSIQNAIVTPQAVVSGQGRELALEALVTDGFVTNTVVSLTGEKPADESTLFTVTIDAPTRSIGWYEMEDFSTADKTYYVIEAISETRFDKADMVISLNEEVAHIELSFEVENSLGNAVIDFPEGAMSGETALRQLQISPMGFMLIGHEQAAQGGLPSTGIELVFANGTRESIEVEFMPSDETIMGGGGMVIRGDDGLVPFIAGFQGMRNEDGELVINATFSRIIDPAGIKKVVIEGVEYPVQ